MVKLINREAKERQATCDRMNAYLKELSNVNSPDREGKSGKSMISRYENLIATCKGHDGFRNEASSTEAVKILKQWHEEGPNGASDKLLQHMNDEDLSRFMLPELERNYRESVVQQQPLARVISKWHHSHLPKLLESHQSRSEEIKTLMARIASEHSRLLTAVAGHLEATKNDVHRFSSCSFISWAHNQRDYESEHRYMKEAIHVDFSNGTTRHDVIFGTVSRTQLEVGRAMQVLDAKRQYSLFHGKPTKDKALELEQHLTTRTNPQIQLLPSDEFGLLLSFFLLSNPPLISLDGAEMKRYGNGISRKDIHTIMSRVTRHDEIAAIFDSWEGLPLTYRNLLAKLMTHREDSQKIVEDIYLKWDLSNNCPFPPWVKRGRK
ncbi:hypothetical protein CPB86DRAFT_878483 [Serendipita vermifera]|nr:hypothetical protein CPB86DRAFT_878483 [Serendipita vermifera]